MHLNLLVASRNMQARSQHGKDKFAINPRMDSQNDLALFHMLGVLFGVCIRTNPVICIELPAIVWKTLVGQRITLADVQEFDEGLLAEMKQLLSADKQKFEELFEDRYFTTSLSAGGATVEIEEGG